MDLTEEELDTVAEFYREIVDDAEFEELICPFMEFKFEIRHEPVVKLPYVDDSLYNNPDYERA